MRRSRRIQTWVQIVGCAGELFLFFSGYMVAIGEWYGAAALVCGRIAIKLAISELMYRRNRANIRECTSQEEITP